ncbi:unnamed protein product [Trifolium pratense]|uniref:Uncharacterized protein n=1 Tax=Trifolium pratense TaxID=57577 RepID=A0ACB0IK96_TRIPR|nr:unnamed protein product [Trifolium pratense]
MWHLAVELQWRSHQKDILGTFIQITLAMASFYCDYFSPNTAYKPKMWTEAWTGWFAEFGGPVPHRPAEDLAFSIGSPYLNIELGHSFCLFQYHGGTNFGRTVGGPFIASSYDYDAPLDEYGLLRQP